MIKIFKIWGKEGQERRKRIKESKDVIVCFRCTFKKSEFFEGKLVPAGEFNKKDYPNAFCSNIYGDEYLVIFNCDIDRIKFKDLFINKDIYIAKKYKDLDGKIAQTKFLLY